MNISSGNCHTQVTELIQEEQVISALLHGLVVMGIKFVRGRGSCIPYFARMNQELRPEYVSSFGSFEY